MDAFARSWLGLSASRAAMLVVGGATGHSKELLSGCTARWSLSKLTFPHMLVRVVVAEQVYRAWTLLSGHPYHRE